MQRYHLSFISKPGFLMPANNESMHLDFNGNYGNLSIVINKKNGITNGIEYQEGLEFIVEVDSTDIESAIRIASTRVDAICSFVSVCSGIGVEPPLIQKAYQISPKSKNRVFCQYYYDPIGLVIPRRPPNLEILNEMITSAIKLDNSSFARIGRSMRWYRMAGLTSDPFISFSCLWFGLENLNPLLQVKLNQPKSGNTSGIKEFIVSTLGKSMDSFQDLRDLRVQIVHGTGALYSDIKKVEDCITTASDVLSRAIIYLLDINDQGRLKLPIVQKGQEFIRVCFELLIEKNEDQLETGALGPNGDEPFFAISANVLPHGDGKSMDVKLQFKAKIANNVKWRTINWVMVGDSDIVIKDFSSKYSG